MSSHHKNKIKKVLTGRNQPKINHGPTQVIQQHQKQTTTAYLPIHNSTTKQAKKEKGEGTNKRRTTKQQKKQ